MTVEKARVLVVDPDLGRRGAVANALLRAGHAVFMCAGPPPCALERDDRCVLVDGADIVVALNLADPSMQPCISAARCAVFAADPTSAVCEVGQVLDDA